MERKSELTVPVVIEGSTNQLTIVDRVLKIFENESGLKPSDIELAEEEEINRASRFLNN